MAILPDGRAGLVHGLQTKVDLPNLGQEVVWLALAIEQPQDHLT